MANRKTGSNTLLTRKGTSDLRNFDCSRSHSSSKMLFQLVHKIILRVVIYIRSGIFTSNYLKCNATLTRLHYIHTACYFSLLKGMWQKVITDKNISCFLSHYQTRSMAFTFSPAFPQFLRTNSFCQYFGQLHYFSSNTKIKSKIN